MTAPAKDTFAPYPPPFTKNLLHPKHWPIWCLMGLWYGVSQLPFRWQLALGRSLGRLLMIMGGSRARIARINIEKCFPELSTQEHSTLLKQHFEALGVGFMEVGFGWWGREKVVTSLTHIEGIEHVRKPQAEGKGVFLLTNHFTPLEIVGRMAGHQFPCRVMYRKNDNPVFEWVSCTCRAHHVDEFIPHKAVSHFLNYIKNGGVGIYMADQDYRARHSVFAPFFGIPTATIRKPTEYVLETGAAVVPTQYWRLPGTQGYCIRFLPALENYPSGDEIVDATRINKLTEDHIRVQPEQYLWPHRRFKHRPEGEKSFY